MNYYDIRGLKEWINNFGGFELYEELPMRSRIDFQNGQFYKAHVKYPFVAPPKILELENYDPENESKTTFKITKFDQNSQRQSQFPIKSLNLHSDERLYILAGKPRPVIVLGYVENKWLGVEKEKMVLCLPIASFHLRHTVEQIVSIQLFEIPHLFYSKPPKNGVHLESAARFELIQPIQIEELQPIKNIHNRPSKLSSYGFKLLLNHLAKFLSNKPIYEKLDEDITAFRNLIREELETQRAKQVNNGRKLK